MKKSITSLVLFVIVALYIFPSTVSAVLKQPPGQFPVTEPLQSVDAGTKPNYSGNIQAGDPTDSNKQEATDESSQSDNSVDETPQDDTPPAESKQTQVVSTTAEGTTMFNIKFIILIIVLAVLLTAGLIYRRRKSA